MKLLPLIISIAALGLCAMPLKADETSQRDLAAKLIDMTNGKETMRAGFDTVMNGVIQNMQDHGLPQAGVDEIKAAIASWYDKEINFDDIRPKLVEVYIKNFTEDDLKTIVAFYETPVGQKTIKSLPVVMRSAAALTQDYMKSKVSTLNEELTPIMVKYRDQMQSAHSAAAPADTAPAK
jgi:hypothetical protein